MASDIDQSLSLKAQLKDEISPALRKMNASIKTTQEALKELGTSTEQLSQTIGSSTQNMADSNSRSAEKLQEDLKKTGGAFQDLSKEARSSSREVGEALKEAFSMGGQGKVVSEMDNELEGLKRTLEGMASTARPITSKSKNVKALGTDTLNRKVIPAFTALHDTLDDFPDALGGVNAGVRANISLSEKMSGSLDAVNKRIQGLGSFLDGLKNSALDIAGGVTSSWFAIQGGKVRDAQTTAARERGPKSFAAMEKIVSTIQRMSMAPEEVWGPAYDKLLDTSSLAASEFPRMIEKMVDLSKATGLASDNFASLFVEMSEISGLTGDEWLDVTKKINFFASSSRASIEDIYGVLATATDEMTKFSREARKTYAENAMAAAAQSANAGLGAGAAQDLWQVAHDTFGAQQQQNMINQAGLDFNVRKAVQSGDQAGHTAKMLEAAAILAEREQQRTGMPNIAALEARGSWEGQWQGSGVSPEMALKAKARREQLAGMGTTLSAEAQRLKDAGQDVNFDSLTGAIRGTAAEKFEQIKAVLNATGMDIGIHTIEAIEKGMDPLIAGTFAMSEKLNELPEMARKGIAFFSIGLNVMSGLKGILPKFLSDAISGPLETLAGATVAGIGVNAILERGDIDAQAEALAPGSPEMQKLYREQLYNKIEGSAVLGAVGDTRGMTGHIPASVDPNRNLQDYHLMDPKTNMPYAGTDQLQRQAYANALAATKAPVTTDEGQLREQTAEERLRAAADLIQATSDVAMQNQSLAESASVTKARWVQDNRAELEGRLGSLKMKAWMHDIISVFKGGHLGGARTGEAALIQAEIDSLKTVLKASPAELVTKQTALDTVVTDAQAGVGSSDLQQQYIQRTLAAVEATNRALSDINSRIPEEQLKASQELRDLNARNNQLLDTLIQVLRASKGIDDETLKKIIDALSKNDAPPGRPIEGVDAVDDEAMGRTEGLGMGRR